MGRKAITDGKVYAVEYRAFLNPYPARLFYLCLYPDRKRRVLVGVPYVDRPLMVPICPSLQVLPYSRFQWKKPVLHLPHGVLRRAYPSSLPEVARVTVHWARIGRDWHPTLVEVQSWGN